MVMRLWITGTIDEVKIAAETGLVGAVVTNPSVVAKWVRDGRRPENIFADVCHATELPLYIQLRGPDSETFLAEFESLRGVSELIVPKLPATAEGLAAAKTLVGQHVQVLVTGVCTVAQAALAVAAGASFICPYFARLNDAGYEAGHLIEQIAGLYSRHDAPTQIVPASIRTTQDFENVLLAGADGAILPYPIFSSSIEHELTRRSLVEFESDWKQITCPVS